MAGLAAALAWTFLAAVVVVQLLFNKGLDSLPGAHLFGYGPAITGVLVPVEVGFDILIAMFATILTLFSVRDNRRPSGRRIGA